MELMDTRARTAINRSSGANGKTDALPMRCASLQSWRHVRAHESAANYREVSNLAGRVVDSGPQCPYGGAHDEGYCTSLRSGSFGHASNS